MLGSTTAASMASSEHMAPPVTCHRGGSSLRVASRVLLLVAASVLAVSAQIDPFELCFEVSWGDPTSPFYRVVKPVNAFPTNHALVENIICGQSFAAGDLIPPIGLWSDEGASDPLHASCRCVQCL
jgi:hypothetical protein